MSGILGLVMVLAVTAALLAGMASVADAAFEDSRATTAADAAALAGAAAGRSAAAEAAIRNGGLLVSFFVDGAVTSVVVTVGKATAEAHAERIYVPA